LNRGMECHGEADVPRHVQSRIYADILQGNIPELCSSSSPKSPAESLEIGSTAPLEASVGPIKASMPRSGKLELASVLGPRATAEGWISVLHDVLMPGVIGSAECTHTAREREASSQNPSRMWASLCSICLVLSARQPAPGSVPHAIIDCRGLHITELDMTARVLKLVGSVKKIARPGADDNQLQDEDEPVKAAKLLLDGRWEEFRLRQLVLSFEQTKMLEIWVSLLIQKPFDATLSESVDKIVKHETSVHNGARGTAAATFKHLNAVDDSSKVFLGFL